MPYEHKNIAYAKKLRKEMTPWERKLWYRFLKGYSVRFQRQKPVGEYIVDFYCAAAKIAVELDGGGHYSPEKQKKDQERTKEIEKFGIQVIRFCNLDIDKNFYSVCSEIDVCVKRNYRR